MGKLTGYSNKNAGKGIKTVVSCVHELKVSAEVHSYVCDVTT
jgi:hypothetical protein